MTRPTVLLFDVDGTLVTTGGVGRRALERAVEELFGVVGAFAAIRMDGMTDLAIVRAGLTAIGVRDDAPTLERVLERYIDVLRDEVSRADPTRYRVHPGMRESIAAAHALGYAVGLGTGNIREGARIKLERVSLFEQFGFGGFGNDAEARPELLAAGAERGAAALGVPRGACRVVVIGDTPKDVLAARAIDAECIGVGTGSFSPEDLLEAGATAAFPTLEAPLALETLLGSSGSP